MPSSTDFMHPLIECDEKSVGKGFPPHWQEPETEYTSKEIKERTKKNIAFDSGESLLASVDE